MKAGAAAALGLCLAATGWAQQVPDAGRVLQQTERDQDRKLPQVQAPLPAAIAASGPQSGPAAGPRILVSAIKFTGNERFSAAQLLPVVEDYLQKSLSLNELEDAAAAVERYYRAQGWLARVIVPPQDVDHGVVTLKVLEGVYGRTRFSADSDKGVTPEDARLIIASLQARQVPGDKFSLANVERGLLLANDLPGLGVTGQQVKGVGEAQTDVLLQAVRKPMLSGEVGLDNEGSRGTGATRGVLRVGVGVANPFHLGEQFDMQAQVTQDLRYLRLAGSMPIGSDGLRLSANVAGMHYRVGSAEFAALQPRGDSRSAGLDLLYPVVRSLARNLYLGMGAEEKRPYNTTTAAVVSDYRIDDLSLRVDGNAYNSWLGGGTGSGNLTQVFGRVSPDAGSAATANPTQGPFRVLRYRATQSQNLNAAWSVTANFSGQAASTTLDSAEKFYLGGASGVRAYPTSEAGGSNGQMLNLDLRYRLPGNGEGVCGCELSAFYDWGHVTVNVNGIPAGLLTPNSYALSGFGLGLSGNGPGRSHITAAVARRIGNNPGASPATGLDQDGSLERIRAWLTLTTTF